MMAGESHQAGDASVSPPSSPWRRRLVVIVVLVVATTLPHLIGWARQTNGNQYLARIPSNPYDSSAYYSNIEQAREGRWLFANQLTSEAQQPSMFHPIWLIGGWIQALINSDAAVAFQIIRILAIIPFVIVLDIFLGQWFTKSRDRWMALWIMTTSAGLGWLFTKNLYLGTAVLRAPIDIWVDEANTFRSIQHSAQFIVSQIFLLGLLWATFQRTQGERRKYHRWVGPAIALLGFFHPYDLITGVAVTAAWFATWAISFRPTRKQLTSTLLTIIQWWLWAVPPALYYILGPLRQIAMRGWFEQNITESPALWVVAVGYGLMIPLAVIGVIKGRATKRAAVSFLVCWILVVTMAMYIPGLNVQRRLLSGLHIPMAVLTAIGLFWLVNKAAPAGGHKRFAVALIALLSTTNAQFIRSASSHIITPDRWDAEMYASADTMRVSTWLHHHSSIDEVVLANYYHSNMLVGLIGRPMAYAHTSQTVHYLQRKQDWQLFSQATTTAEQRADIVQRLRVQWLYWTPEDTARGGYEPSQDPAWSIAYQSGSIILFRARR